MADIATLLHDPKFVGLSRDKQKQVLGGIDPRFSNLSDAAYIKIKQSLAPDSVTPGDLLQSAKKDENGNIIVQGPGDAMVLGGAALASGITEAALNGKILGYLFKAGTAIATGGVTSHEVAKYTGSDTLGNIAGLLAGGITAFGENKIGEVIKGIPKGTRTLGDLVDYLRTRNDPVSQTVANSFAPENTNGTTNPSLARTPISGIGTPGGSTNPIPPTPGPTPGANTNGPRVPITQAPGISRSGTNKLPEPPEPEITPIGRNTNGPRMPIPTNGGIPRSNTNPNPAPIPPAPIRQPDPNGFSIPRQSTNIPPQPAQQQIIQPTPGGYSTPGNITVVPPAPVPSQPKVVVPQPGGFSLPGSGTVRGAIATPVTPIPTEPPPVASPVAPAAQEAPNSAPPAEGGGLSAYGQAAGERAEAGKRAKDALWAEHFRSKPLTIDEVNSLTPDQMEAYRKEINSTYEKDFRSSKRDPEAQKASIIAHMNGSWAPDTERANLIGDLTNPIKQEPQAPLENGTVEPKPLTTPTPLTPIPQEDNMPTAATSPTSPRPRKTPAARKVVIEPLATNKSFNSAMTDRFGDIRPGDSVTYVKSEPSTTGTLHVVRADRTGSEYYITDDQLKGMRGQ